MAKFAFWNIQRIGNMEPKGDKAADRVGLFQMYVEQVITQVRPSFFVLAEVTSQGDKIVTWLQKANWNAAGYTAEFVPVNHAKNPCNYVVIKKKTDAVKFLGVTGNNVQRPYVGMESTNGIKVAFAHLKSGGSEKTAEELLTFLWDLAGDVHALCGDLNLDFNTHFSKGASLGKEVADAGFKALSPPTATYQKEAWNKRLGAFKHTAKTLDFLVYAANLTERVAPLPITYDKDFHALIDHAPIAFQIKAA